ncbi:MAG TPA: hypothetical protein VGC63_01565 [Solirubrobacterales bacterium]
MNLAADEGTENQVERPLWKPPIQPRKAQVREVDTLVEPPQSRGEPGPQRLYGLFVEVGQEALGDDHQSLGRIQGFDKSLEAARATLLEDIQAGDAMAVRQRLHTLQRVALSLCHARQVRLDIGKPLAELLGEAPTPRRHPAGDLDHLADAAAN